MPKTYAENSQQLTVPKYFYRPEGSSNWYVRAIAPTHVLHLVKDREFRKSTRQSDLKRAKPIGLALIAEKLREWDALAKHVPEAPCSPTLLTSGLIERICAVRLYSWMRSDDDDRLHPEGLSTSKLAEMDDFCALTDAAMRSVLVQGAASPDWSDVVETLEDWCVTMGHSVETDDALFTTLVRDFAKVEKEAQVRIARRNKGDDAETPTVPLEIGATLSAISAPFRQHKAVRACPKHLGTTLNVWTLLIEHCGDIPLNSVTPNHLFEFMHARMHAKVKPWSETRAKLFGKRVLREAFGLARTTGMMTVANPVDAMEAFPTLSKAEETSRLKPRYPFNSRQLNEIFGSGWYDPANSNLVRGKMKADLGARYWVPLLGLFHGNRVHEALQLVASDFSFDKDLFVLTFRREIDAQDDDVPTVAAGSAGAALTLEETLRLRHLKNAATNRTVPVHPRLIALGLVEFVAQRRNESGASALLFPSSAPNPGGESPKLGRSYEQAFLRLVRDRLGFGHGFGNHSFRHQLEDRIRAAQRPGATWPAGMGQQYAGRKRTRGSDLGVLQQEGSESDYGRGFAPLTMLRYVETLDFGDVSLPAPFLEWRKPRPESKALKQGQ